MTESGSGSGAVLLQQLSSQSTWKKERNLILSATFLVLPVLQCVPNPGPIDSCEQYAIKDPSVGTRCQLFDPTGTTLVGCTQNTFERCPDLYPIYFAKAGFNAKPTACQQSLPPGQTCADLYGGKYSQEVTGDFLEGCVEPCNPATEYVLYEQRYPFAWAVPELAECVIKPFSCDAKYGAGNYAALYDGTAGGGGIVIGCLKYETFGGEAGADQACPEGFDFAVYGAPTVANSRVPVLKQCWKTNGGNADW
jgi:hypothetical protein